MAVSNDQLPDTPPSIPAPRLGPRSHWQNSPRSGRSDTGIKCTGAPGSTKTHEAKATLAAAATQTSARSSANIIPSTSGVRGHAKSEKSASVSTSRSLSAMSAEEMMTTQRQETSRTVGTTATSAMSTARAEATLALLDEERTQLEHRLKKVEEELEQEEALGKKDRRGGHLNGNAPRTPH